MTFAPWMQGGPSWLPQGQRNDPFGMTTPQAGGIQSLLRDPNFALALLANSRGQRFGQALGTAGLQASQMGQQRQDDALRQEYMKAQIQRMQQPEPGRQPASVQEYEYAKQNGFNGTFQDWIVAGGQSSRPSSVLEWEFYNNLIEEDKKNGTNKAPQYLEMKRNPNFKVESVNQIPTVVNPSIVGGVRTTPLSTLPQVAASASAVKQAEAAGSGLGQAQGAIAGGIQTKGANAVSVLGMLDEADKIVDDATGSLGGSAVDAVAGAVGKSTAGAKAIARLKVLQAGLMLNMPRMEGPQSDRDVQLYREAAASLGESTVPKETKKAALQQIRQLQIKYAERAVKAPNATAPFAIHPRGSAESNQATIEDVQKLLDKYAPQ